MNYSKTSPLYLTRFIAAYLILIYHYHTKSLLQMLPSMRHFAEPVNYFFFISGFVMIVSSKKCLQFGAGLINFSKKDFWLKRIARVYPMYILALFLFVLFNYTVKEIDASIPKRVWFEITGLQRWVYKGSVNFPDWSVSCEFFFYFLFPFTLPWIVKSSFKKVGVVALTLFFVSVVFTFYYKELLMPRLLLLNQSNVYKLMLDSVLLHPAFKYTIFLCGCLCGRFYLSSPQMLLIEKYNVFIFILSLAAIILFYKYNIINDIILEAGMLSLLYFPFVLSICSFKGKLLQVFSWQPFIFLGEISYGIYIFQAPAEHYFEFFFTNNQHFTSNSQFFSYTLFLIVVCSILYYLYEMPVKKVITSFFQNSKVRNSIAVHTHKI